MQNSELYRRGIVLPLDDEAEAALRQNDVNGTIRVRQLVIPGQSVFERLWDLGLFERISDQCSVDLDDYEEDWIKTTSMKEAMASVESIAKTSHDPDLEGFLAELTALITEAEVLRRPLLFVL